MTKSVDCGIILSVAEWPGVMNKNLVKDYLVQDKINGGSCD